MSDGMTGRRVVIVGGAGFIGHNLALALRQREADVHVIDSLQINNLGAFAAKVPELYDRELYLRIIHERLNLLNAADVQLNVQDARDYAALDHLIEDIRPHVLIHLAAVAHAGRANKDPYSTFDHSLRTLENALDCSRGRAEQFIFLSSSMAYGNFETSEVNENHPLNPIGIYGALKVAGEKMVIAYGQVFDLPYTIIRPSALYGPRCVSRRVGQVFIESALNGSRLRVDGDGSERLDFTYIEDLIGGVMLAMQKPAARGEVFNVTYGQSRSIRDLVDVVKAQFPDVQVESVERDRLMPVRGTLSIDKARRLLGYRPQYPLERGFPRYVDWYRSLAASSSRT